MNTLDFIFKSSENIISGTFDILSDIFSSEQPATYNAAFGNENDHLSMFNHGFAITGSKALTKELSHTNVALFGPTGSGKSSIIIASSLVSLGRGKSSIIINDVSGEIWNITSSYLAKKGYRILRLDFSNSNASETFNPLQKCHSISDIQKVALLIITNALGDSASDPFWNESAIMLFSLFARYLVFYAPEEYRTIQNVLRLIETFAVDNGDILDSLFANTNDESLINGYKAALVLGSKTLQSIIQTLRSALSLWCDDEVCKTTSSNSIDFDILRTEPVALFVSNPLKDLRYFKPLSALFFQSLFNHILSRVPEKEERSIFFLLDEAATMRFPNLSITVSNIRKFSAGILLCMQDEMSLISQYGQAEAHQIKTNCATRIYLKGQPLHTCRELSAMLGIKTIFDENGIEKGRRELMTIDEIRMAEEAIIFINNQLPLKCKMVPYYENIWMSGLNKSVPHPFPKTCVKKPALFPLNK